MKRFGRIFWISFAATAAALIILVGVSARVLPGQARQVGLDVKIDVAATAQAIRAKNNRARLEAHLKTQQDDWETRLHDLEQTLERTQAENQAQISQLEKQLTGYRTQIDDLTRQIQEAEQTYTQLQQVVQADETTYQQSLEILKAEYEPAKKEIENELTVVEDELQTTMAALEAASPSGDGPAGDTSTGTDQQDDSASDGAGDSSNDNHDDSKDDSGDDSKDD